MSNTRVLVTGATGRIGTAVATQLLDRGVPTRAMVRVRRRRAARGRGGGGGPGAVAGESRASLAHDPPPLAADKLFELLPDTAHVAVDPGFFADNYMNLLPTAAQLGILPVPTGAGRNAPPSNEDIARVAVGALLDPHRHDGRAYRPTGPALLSGADIADAIGEALGRRVRHIDVSPPMFMKAVRAGAKQMGAGTFLQSSLYHYLPETALGTWEFGGPTSHVRDVAGVEPEDFLTIARRYTTGPQSSRTIGNFLRAVGGSLRIALTPMHDLDGYERAQEHPRPAHPRLSGESEIWRAEHAPLIDTAPTDTAPTDTASPQPAKALT